MKKLRVGIIGCGRISPMHLISADTLEQAELVACCDIKKDRAEATAEKYGIKAYVSYTDMLEEESLDAVHLCLPHYLHTKIARECFKHGVHVLSEKPMDIDLESAEAAIAEAKSRGVLYGVIFQFRYNPSARLVKSAIESGKLGRVISARSVLTWKRERDYYSSSDWNGSWDKEGGGVIINQAIHSIDLVNWIVDSDFESVSCTMSQRSDKGISVEDTAEGLVTYKNGAKYAFYAMNNYGCDESIEIRLYCENGKATLDYDNATIRYNDGSVEEVHLDKDPMQYPGGKVYWGVQHIRQIEQFYNAILGLEPLEISGEEALKTHCLVMKMYEVGGMKK